MSLLGTLFGDRERCPACHSNDLQKNKTRCYTCGFDKCECAGQQGQGNPSPLKRPLF